MLFISFCVLGLRGKAQQAQGRADARMAQECISLLTDVIIHDITSPPVASRDYVYPVIAFYEAVRPCDSTYESFGGRLNGLKPLPVVSPGLGV